MYNTMKYYNIEIIENKKCGFGPYYSSVGLIWVTI